MGRVTKSLSQQTQITQELAFEANQYLYSQSKGCLTREHIIALQNQLANYLVNRGYLTSRVSVPDQNLNAGILQLTWQAGLIGGVQSDQNAIGNSAMLMPLRAGHIYNQRDWDQAIENLHRLPSQSQSKLELTPADTANTSMVVYQMASTSFKDRISGSMGVDNSGNDGSGRYQANASLSIDSPLGLYDQLTINLGNNANAGVKQYHNRNYGVYWDVPLGYANLQLAATQSNYLRTIPGYHSDLAYTGKTQEYFANLNLTAYRSEQSIGSINFKLARKRNYSYVDATELDVQRKDYLYAQLGWLHRYYYQNQQYHIGVDYKFALPGESQSMGFIYGQPQWDGNFNVLTLNAGARIPFQWNKQIWRYATTFKIQKGSRPLPDTELFTLGSRYNVRGTDEQYGLSAENGLLWRNELNWLYKNALQPYAGLDWGITHGASASPVGRALAGAVLGIRGQYRSINYDLAMGYPIYKPTLFTQRGPSVTGSLNYTF